MQQMSLACCSQVKEPLLRLLQYRWVLQAGIRTSRAIFTHMSAQWSVPPPREQQSTNATCC